MLRKLAAAGVGLAFAATAAAVCYQIVAARRLRTFQTRPQRMPASTPPVTILKPLAGDDGDLFENLSSFVEQAYPNIQVIFGVTRPDDPAIDAVQRVIDRFPDADISLVIGNDSRYANPKVANLSAMIAQAKHGLLVISDADMCVGAAYLDAVVAEFDDPRTGAVTCIYCGEPGDDELPSILGAMYINEQFAPSVLVANLVEPLTYCFGSTMAIRREVFDEIGGFDALGSHIGDDYLLGQLVSERGYRVALAPYVVRNIVHEPNFRALIAHELRWARTIRAQRPVGYASLVLTQPVFCALLLACATRGSWLGWGALAVSLGSRAIVAAAASRTFMESDSQAGQLWALPLRDGITAAVWIAGFFAREVRWRDQALSIGRNGRLSEH